MEHSASSTWIAPISMVDEDVDATVPPDVTPQASQDSTPSSDRGWNEEETPGGKGRGKRGKAGMASRGKKRPASVVEEEDEDVTPVKSKRGSRAKDGTPGTSPQKPLQTKEYRIMFTGLGDFFNDTVETLGGRNVETWSECTHLVTDKIRRTVKFLAALTAGKHIVSDKWLLESRREGRFVAEAKFLLKDKATEEKFGFSLAQSLKSAQSVTRTLLLQGPPPNELEEIVRAAGGEMEECVIIGCEEDEVECRRLHGFVLTGILRQQLDYVGHVLSGGGGSMSTRKRR
ncbi:BRCT domain-containing protein [Chytridium lagenaria]|nr:BRCT domain-containing protein [Chytridium lagenaria]